MKEYQPTSSDSYFTYLNFKKGVYYQPYLTMTIRARSSESFIFNGFCIIFFQWGSELYGKIGEGQENNVRAEEKPKGGETACAIPDL
jgi:hypothetical protein